MKKQFLIVGNWKMNTDIVEAENLATNIAEALSEDDCQTVICPPAVFLEQVYLTVADYKLAKLGIGVQNISWEEKGAFTGDLSANMVKNWARYAIIGHSERRQYFAETNALINKKIKLALAADLIPILCIGEKRLLSNDISELGRDLTEGMAGLSVEEAKKVVVAYEPVWAIGTGEAANPGYANKIMRELRTWLKDDYGFEVAESVKILYGGSVNEKNSNDYLKEEHIDGLLIGGASLKPEVFIKIIKQVQKIK